MPGHTIEAICACGFRKELSPGLDENEPISEFEMAYIETGRDLQTIERSEIARRKLRVLSDPFLDDGDQVSAKELLAAALERRRKPQGPHHCPQCNQSSLFLTFNGLWE